MKIIIPMAGQGSRFIKVGYKDPKPLIPVDGIPMIEHVIKLFNHPLNHNMDFIFICNKDHLITTDLRNIILKIKPNSQIIAIEANKKGPVYTVHDAIDQIFNDEKSLYDEVIISYCDYGTNWNFDAFLREARSPLLDIQLDFHKQSNDGIIACYRGFHPHMLGTDNYAFVKTDDNHNIIEIQEKKPFTNNRMQEFASNGTYYFKQGSYVKKYFKELIDKKIEINGEYYVSLVYNLMIKDGLHASVFEIQHMLQWGTPYDLSIYQMWSNYFRNRNNYSKYIRHPPRTNLVLPLAGRGNRFSVQGFDLPKPLLPVDNEAMVVQAGKSLPLCDKNIFICLDEHIIKYNIDKLLNDKFNNTNIIAIKNVTAGQACTCEIAIKDLDPDTPICITACDNGVIYNETEYQKLLDDQNVDCIVWSFRNNPTSVNNPHMYAWLDIDHHNYIKHVFVKKCPFDNPLERHAIIGTMFFRKAKYFTQGLKIIYDKNIRTNGEFYVDDLLNPLLKAD